MDLQKNAAASHGRRLDAEGGSLGQGMGIFLIFTRGYSMILDDFMGYSYNFITLI